ncbi:ion channel, partial [Paraburkholderia dipogonis]
TVGYGGITPHGHATRSLAILEALICQLYPTIVLARLVSLHVAGNRPDTNRP